MDYQDPGWRPVFGRSFPMTLVPGLNIAARRLSKGRDGITSLRAHFVAIFIRLCFIGIVLFFIVPPDRWWAASGPMWFVGLVLVASAVSVVGILRIRSWPLPNDSPKHLAQSFRSLTFIGIGLGAAPALGAFVATQVLDSLWVYFAGLAVAGLCLLLVAPSKREIARRQSHIATRGATLSLGQALLDNRSSW